MCEVLHGCRRTRGRPSELHLESQSLHVRKVCITPHSRFSAMATTSSPPLWRNMTTADHFRNTMNKFLNRKKTPEAIATTNEDAYNALSSPPPTPGVKKSATSRWKKTKKPAEPKQEEQFNIAAVLPASDDFRTSLLMPNLSARFSMLREQDDPNSILGKASDDSVLQPRRRSRMLDYGFGSNGLNDIAEVQSINSSIRPPFAAYSRQESFGSEDGYGSENESTHNGSILGRARPGEGNVLFGGRQKVYKIPMNGASSTKLGRAVYGDDIGESAFQKYRKEREAQEGRGSEEDPGFDFGLDQVDAGDQDDTHHATPNDSAKDLSHSPSLSSYDRKRSTTSSVARSEARLSTPATSIASQPAVSAPSPLAVTSQAPAAATTTLLKRRSDTKTRRLYDQGLDQHIQEQQTTALSRLNSIQRQRSQQHKPSPPFLQSAKSANNIHEQTKQPVYALRAQSPAPILPLAPLNTFGSMRRTHSSNASPIASGPQSPISPDFDDATPLTEALDPNDRGKATAMGAFNKPAQQFDEKQYLERQQQLQRSLSKPGLRKDAAFQQRIGRFEQIDRDRSTSDASARSRSGSAPNAPPKGIPRRGDSLRKRHEPTQTYNVFQNAANQMPTKQGAQQYDTHRTFFGNISASDSEEEDDDQEEYQSEFGYGAAPGRWQPTPLQSVSEHPALRGHSAKPSLAEEEEEEDEDLEPRPLRPTPSSLSLRNDAQMGEDVRRDDIDSPTLGPSSSEPLNGMVHHLRQKSNVSSLYPNEEDFQDFTNDGVPELPGTRWNAKSPDSAHLVMRNTFDSDPRIESSYTNSNPWDLDEIDNAYDPGAGEDRSSISQTDGSRSQGTFASPAPSRADVPGDRQSEASQYSELASAPTWQNELRKQHTRDASTATQLERDAFADELAARRNAIKENIKSIVERDNSSRNVSPAPSATGAFKAFGMLRSKSSRESVDIGRGPSAPTKAMKMLGIGASASTTNLSSQYERPSFDLARVRGDSGSRVPPLPTAREPSRTRGDSEASKTDRRQPAGRSPAASDASKARSRSNSEATTGRARSRTGPYRDDLERAMVEGVGSSAASHTDLSPMMTREPTPRVSPDIVQSSFDSETRARARSNSRPPVISNYFDAKNLHAINTASQGRLAAAGTSPVTLSPNVYSPAGVSGRPSAGSPMTQMPTPPHSGANTPQGSTFTLPPNMPIIQPRSGVLRKKTVSKLSISEPTLISSTSNVDTVDLPEGASLRNGMDSPPPVPPINPKRRTTRKVFGLGRSGMSADALNYSNFGRSKTPDPWMSRATPEADFAATRTVRQASDGRPGIHPQQGFENHSTPALLQYGIPQPTPTGSPERIERSPMPQHHAAMEGGMF